MRKGGEWKRFVNYVVCYMSNAFHDTLKKGSKSCKFRWQFADDTNAAPHTTAYTTSTDYAEKQENCQDERGDTDLTVEEKTLPQSLPKENTVEQARLEKAELMRRAVKMVAEAQEERKRIPAMGALEWMPEEASNAYLYADNAT